LASPTVNMLRERAVSGKHGILPLSGLLKWKSRIFVTVAIFIVSTRLFLDLNKGGDIEVEGRESNHVVSTSISCLPKYVEKQFVQVHPDNVAECLINEKPSNYIALMSKVLVGLPREGSYAGGNTKNVRPYDEGLRAAGADWPPLGYSMIGKARMENLRCAIAEVNRNQIRGSVVELGVWRGGAMMLAAAMVKESFGVDAEQRSIYLFDVFGTLKSGSYGSIQSFLDTSLEDVRSGFEYLGLDGPNIHYEVGLFKDTLPTWKNRTDPIAVLRVDGNFYDSYQDAMYYLYENVPVGGIVIFDDVQSHPNVMRLWRDFKAEQGLPEELVPIDMHSAWFRKTKQVQLDWKYFRPPQDANKES